MLNKPTILFALLAVIAPTCANEKSPLMFDAYQAPEHTKTGFPNPKNIQPKHSSFAIKYSAFMSSNTGERWAVVTLINEANGSRTFNNNQIMALFANGERKLAKPISHSFYANDSQSVAVSFGKNQFPILQVYVNN